MLHYSVLLQESIDALNIQPNGIYVDLTVGMGGHSEVILSKLTTGHLYAFDKDDYAIEVARQRLTKVSNNFTLIKADFKDIKSRLNELGVYEVNGIIADLGVSSPQLDQAQRGFSYNKDAQLDMRMDQNQSLSAYDVINNYNQQQLSEILIKYADVKLAKQVAKAIVKNRPIATTLQLVEVIKSAYPAALLRQKNPAKAVFQAIRIEVNDEMNSLQKMLDEAIALLNSNAVLTVITFHSIEDRIVKQTFARLIKSTHPAKLPVQETRQYFTKSILPTQAEIEVNRRSKSAKLRKLVKL
ncbi:16S rRNA (cytosine1402-N4)-methyltransferase [Mycoplasmopsis mustelae]|uniref:Ribosomal RNA small subunit methyltransferase H n=1 Tax=Mycoplasmopsis mustelae TaxID=171289 RepID=A0A4R7UE52_9BACT|nr:16S rRNA (cytosine(1402)-N(4))-methyltransferase RsmH [Mycoplasmopsis mustelae]TDV24113.1 16S rRNA (cytosine1402-N4)-methyltransferase [Mycoplasmopsis mustelae]